MKARIILLGLFILIILLWIFIKPIEGFQNQQLDPNIASSYNSFLSSYNTFCSNWQKAIQSSVAANIQQQPLTSPSQVQSSQAPQISTEDMNKYINLLSIEQSMTFPPICSSSLPTTVDSSNISQVIQMIPQDSQPYVNALNWMNSQLSKSIANLNSSLQVEGFDVNDPMCQEVSQCVANNPQLAQQIAQQIADQNDRNFSLQEQQLSSLINNFMSNPELPQALDENQKLVAKSKEIQDQAQSGQLVNQITVTGGDQNQFSMPPNGDTLSQMKQNDPDSYNHLKSNYSSWFSVKQLMEQINANLG
jgi:hypothetical protein